MHPAIFLDRDGVIIENRANYVRSWADVTLYPQALQALANASQSLYKFIIVTNQSAVGRGILPYQLAVDINNRVITKVAESGGRIDSAYLCPHAPQDHCYCRKPKPGLLLQAAKELSLDLSRSIMIGDALSDIQAGQAAGVYKTILVKTGRGAAQAMLPQAASLAPFCIHETLAEALADLSAN